MIVIYIPELESACVDLNRHLRDLGMKEKMVSNFIHTISGTLVRVIGLVTIDTMVRGMGQIELVKYGKSWSYGGSWVGGTISVAMLVSETITLVGDDFHVLGKKRRLLYSGPEHKSRSGSPRSGNHLPFRAGSYLIRAPLVPDADFEMEAPDGTAFELDVEGAAPFELADGFFVTAIFRSTATQHLDFVNRSSQLIRLSGVEVTLEIVRVDRVESTSRIVDHRGDPITYLKTLWHDVPVIQSPEA